MLLRHARALFTLAAAAVIGATTLVATEAPAQAATFSDTAGTSYEHAVSELADDDIILGCTETRFCPKRSLTRGQLASILVRAFELPASDATPFRDVAGNTHEDNINALAAEGITEGCADGRFCPSDRITRDELASMLVRAYDMARVDEAYFNDVGGAPHGSAVNALAANGVAAGCGRPEGAFCPKESLQRQQAALFVARAEKLIDRVSVPTLAERRAEQQAQAASSRDRIWDDLAQCESGGNWSINTGNGYYGGLQFSLGSWQAVGGSGYPHHHSREEQIKRGELLLDKQGWGAWPACSSKLGYR